MQYLSNMKSRIVVLNMATVVVTLHTAVLAASQNLEPALQLHRRHCCHHPHRVLHPPLQGLQSVQMELVEVRLNTRVRDQHMG